MIPDKYSNRNALGLEGSIHFGTPEPQLVNGTANESEHVTRKDEEPEIKVIAMIIQLIHNEELLVVPQVYGAEWSPPCRVVYLTCEAAGVPYVTEKVDPIATGDNMKPDYLEVRDV